VVEQTASSSHRCFSVEFSSLYYHPILHVMFFQILHRKGNRWQSNENFNRESTWIGTSWYVNFSSDFFDLFSVIYQVMPVLRTTAYNTYPAKWAMLGSVQVSIFPCSDLIFPRWHQSLMPREIVRSITNINK
jgi:hypothetical protein